MLSLPFRGLPVRLLRILLVALIAVEVVLALSLYETARPLASGPSHTATSRGSRPTTVASHHRAVAATLPIVQNTPRTVVAGDKEVFSVKLPRLPNTFVTYTLTYPNEASMTKVMKTDATGFSKVVLVIDQVPATYREPVVLSVYFNGTQEATTRFAVQQPAKAATH